MRRSDRAQVKPLHRHAGDDDFGSVIDHYRTFPRRDEDSTRAGTYDLVLDLVAQCSVFACRRSLARGGRYRRVGGTTRTLLRPVTAGTAVGALTGRRSRESMGDQPVGDGQRRAGGGAHLVGADAGRCLAQNQAAVAHDVDDREVGDHAVHHGPPGERQ